MSYFALGCPAPGGTPAPHRCGVTSQAGGRGGALQAGLAATRTPSVTGSAGAGASTGDCLQGVCGRCVCVCVCVCSFHRCASPHGIAAAWPAAGSHASANAQVESYASTHARRPLLLISSHAAAPAPGRGGSRQASALKRRTHRQAPRPPRSCVVGTPLGAQVSIQAASEQHSHLVFTVCMASPVQSGSREPPAQTQRLDHPLCIQEPAALCWDHDGYCAG